MTAPSKPAGGSVDLYENGELPEYHDTVDTFIAWSDEILNWHHHRPPLQRQTSRSAPTTCSKSCDAAPTASPTHATSKPAAHPRDIMTQPVPATLNPTNSRRAKKIASSHV